MSHVPVTALTDVIDLKGMLEIFRQLQSHGYMQRSVPNNISYRDLSQLGADLDELIGFQAEHMDDDDDNISINDMRKQISVIASELNSLSTDLKDL